MKMKISSNFIDKYVCESNLRDPMRYEIFIGRRETWAVEVKISILFATYFFPVFN